MTAATETCESPASSSEHPGGRRALRLSGGLPLLGHLLELRRFEFELAQPAASYANDLSKRVVAVKQPYRVRYRRRAGATLAASALREKVERAIRHCPTRALRIEE